ncbi:methyltransferase domain-containing protein, partial [Sphaerotilus natans]
ADAIALTIGDGAVIAANSVVTKNIGAYEIHGGNPAKIIRSRFEEKTVQQLKKLQWWNLPKEEIYQIINQLCSQPNEASISEINSSIQSERIMHQNRDANHPPTRINICIIQPQGYIHSLGLLDPARYFRHQLRSVGASVSITKNRLHHDAINIIFGAHLGFDHTLTQRHSCIFVNLEQLGAGGYQASKDYISLLGRSAVIDYDVENPPAYTSHTEDVPLAHFVKAPYLSQESISTLPLEERPIDLLFFGSMNERRKKIISAIEAQGITVSVFDKPLYGEERDSFIRQAKAVLNCHFYESSRFEQVRVSHCLSLGTPVIAERGPNTRPASFYEEAVSWFTEEKLEEFFSSCFGTPDWYAAAIQQISYFEQLDASENFSEILEFATGYQKENKRHINQNTWIPNKINLGSGKDYKPGWLNIDILARTEPDIVLDLSKNLNLPTIISSKHWGMVKIDSFQFDIIYANNVLEHVPDLVGLMTQCLHLLKEEGTFEIEVPYEKSLTAWQDPTHIRALNENSWIYYTEWFWYLGWFEHRFEMQSSSYLDQRLQPCNREQAAFMKVCLKKIRTSPHERTVARTMQANWIIPDDEPPAST